MGLNYDSERMLVTKQEFDEALNKYVNEELKSLKKSKAHKLEVIGLALRCPMLRPGYQSERNNGFLKQVEIQKPDKSPGFSF